MVFFILLDGDAGKKMMVQTTLDLSAVFAEKGETMLSSFCEEKNNSCFLDLRSKSLLFSKMIKGPFIYNTPYADQKQLLFQRSSFDSLFICNSNEEKHGVLTDQPVKVRMANFA